MNFLRMAGVSLLVLVSVAGATSFQVNKGTITYQASAGYTFEGSNSTLQGKLDLDPEKPANLSGTLTLDSRAFRSDNSTRDRHAENMVFRSRFFKDITLTLTGSDLKTPLKETFTPMVLKGKLTLRETTREVTIVGQGRFSGGRAEFQGTFALDLRDYGITPPSLLVVVVAPTVTVRIDAVAQRQ